uniref:Uncharacterized protein n=1 Tax=Ananas comosus var. bracteatus TaxID=296719 RepID=A0A6V7PJI8_ANACO|nr:unnamed protein product [Ananas comosus var. bracteatus]
MAPAPSSNDPLHASEEGGGRSESSQSREVAWLSSLSESELDFLISLKEMAAMRAKNVGFSDLAEKFDVRTLRALGIVLLENFKERVKSTSADPKLVEMLALLSGSGLAAPNQESSSCSNLSVNDVSMPSFVTPRRKRMWDGLRGESVQGSCKKQKTEKSIESP